MVNRLQQKLILQRTIVLKTLVKQQFHFPSKTQASYKVSFEYLTKLKTNLKRLLDIPEKHSPAEKDAHGEALMFLTSYFQSTTENFNLDPIIQVSVDFFMLAAFSSYF